MSRCVVAKGVASFLVAWGVAAYREAITLRGGAERREYCSPAGVRAVARNVPPWLGGALSFYQKTERSSTDEPPNPHAKSSTNDFLTKEELCIFCLYLVHRFVLMPVILAMAKEAVCERKILCQHYFAFDRRDENTVVPQGTKKPANAVIKAADRLPKVVSCLPLHGCFLNRHRGEGK